MKINNETHDETSHTRRAIDCICDQFEAEWEKNSGYRIENLFKSNDELAELVSFDANQPDFADQIIAELIRVEMNLRFQANQLFDPFEYYSRFPDFVAVIDQSMERLKRLDVDKSLDSLELVATSPMDGKSDFDNTSNWILAQTAHDALPHELGFYKRIARIGAGGFGVVCKAIDSRNGKEVALKFPRKRILANNELLKLFLDEANRARDLDHPGIVKTESVIQVDGYLAMVQQLIDGTDLEKTIDQPRSQREIAELIAAIADALAYANRQGIIHRDLKPSNILLDHRGRPYIADFGLALHESVQLNSPNVRCGTTPYMSPQLVAGLTKNLDGRTDIWSLGVILYELLTGKRPFRGHSKQDIYQQIETRDPRPLREIDAKIHKDLQWICLKCLSRQARDRYLTADELANDLRDWIGRPPETVDDKPPAVFVPKGLRSYSDEDSSFFLQLLPGPRDRDAVPASIRFWSVRICEPVAVENRIPIGVIYGPSGSGKSSFVKAGLIPRVRPQVDTIYVESTQADTEVRLIKALRDQFPEIPPDLSLPEIFAGLSVGRWQKSPRKILIVLDQFEQRLSVADHYDNCQLVKALRHCDGHQLQCLLLVRVDFWLSLTRFADALEMDLLEGQNSQDIDLFDREHAKKVLIKLGRAYGRLPDEQNQLTKAQHEFLDQTIDQLALGQYVICVRLTLFAEMFKSRPWTPAELESVGGIQGVGEKFFEETFDSGGSASRFHLQRGPVQAVLEALLPESGSDIRGAMKTEAELLAASKYENQPNKFKDLMKTLDKDFRLITRTDPDSSGEANAAVEPNSQRTGNYQLTHDYLVPAIRDWLTSELRKNRRGRALLRLRELASQVIPGQPPKYLPTNSEWLSWQLHLRNEHLTDNEDVVMRYASRRFLASFARVAVVLGLSTVIISYFFVKDRRNRIANELVAGLVGKTFDQAPQTVAQLQNYANRVVPRLKLIVKNSNESNAEEQRKALLGLVPFESARADEVIENITRATCSPSELRASLRVLNDYTTEAQRVDFEIDLASKLDDYNNDPRVRFRAAVLLAHFGKENRKWSDDARLIGSILIREPVTTYALWVESLRPIGGSILTEFMQMFSETDQRDSALALSMAIYEFTTRDQRNREFSRLVLNSNDAQFDSILSLYEQNQQIDVFREQLSNVPIQKLGLNEQRATATKAIALLRSGDLDGAKEFSEILKNKNQPGIRSYGIILANPNRIDFRLLRKVFESEAQSNVSLRQGILMALAERASQVNDETHIKWLESVVNDRCLHEEDAVCFAASELIARRRGIDFMVYRKQRKQSSNSGVKGNVFINSNLQAFSIIRHGPDNKPRTPIAVSMTEVSRAEMSRWKGSGLDVSPTTPNQPFIIPDFSCVYPYCNWLSGEDGLLDSEFVYSHAPNEQDSETKIDLSNPGYRLMTFDEWNVISGTDKNDLRYLGSNKELSDHYAWTVERATSNLQDVGILLPNENGLFDIYGNAQEIYFRYDDSQIKFFAMGRTVRASKHTLSATDGYEFGPNSLKGIDFLMGIRLVRNMPTSSE